MLPDLAVFAQKARTLAQALDEFVTIERHVVLRGLESAPASPRRSDGSWLATR